VAPILQESCSFRGLVGVDVAVLGSELCKFDELGFFFLGLCKQSSLIR
jgi:hypothetical protein